MTGRRPNLLYVTPTVPQPAGNGRAMRAYHMIALFAARYRVYLLIVSREIAGKGHALPPELAALCREVACVPIAPLKDMRMLALVRLYKLSPRFFHQCFSPLRSPYWTPGMYKTLARLFPETGFDVIHGFRLGVVPFAACFARNNFSGLLELDLDDIESLTAFRLSRLSRANGNRKMARAYAYDACHYRVMEKQLLPAFDRVFVCSRIDRERVVRDHGHPQVAVIPNLVDVPAALPRNPAKGTFTFLFVGTLGYYPNHDGVDYFCRRVLPLLRQTAGRNFRLRIAGSGASPALRDLLARTPGVEFVGRVPEVASCYAAADAAIVPLRAGGGTRIKVLEAFAHRCPVISTSQGVEGIDGRPGEHFLVADTSEGLACQCRRLMDEPRLRERLALNAHRLVKEKYCLESVQKELTSMP